MSEMSKTCLTADNWCNSSIECIQTSFVWTIDNFIRRPEGNGEYMVSSTFNAHSDNKTKWCLKLYPYGARPETEEFLTLFLSLKDSDRRELSADYKLALIGNNQHIYRQKEGKHCFEVNRGWGWIKFVTRSSLQALSHTLLPDDRLTIYCEVSYLGKNKTTGGQRIAIKRQHRTLTDDMTVLYQNLNDTDIDIVVNGHKFTAHKLILKARSPVFAAMFEHPMKESQQNLVIIEDIDKQVFNKVLRFIYTDKVVIEDIESNIKLLSAADKYNLDELKSICEEYIGSQLTTKTVCDVLILADSHSAQELKTKAIDFIKANVNKVMKTTGWKNVIDRSDLVDLF